MILVTATAASGLTAAAASRLEGMPTAAARYGVGIIDSEACAHQTVNIVNFTASDVAQAHLIHQHIEATVRNHGIALLLFVERHAVLET